MGVSRGRAEADGGGKGEKDHAEKTNISDTTIREVEPDMAIHRHCAEREERRGDRFHATHRNSNNNNTDTIQTLPPRQQQRK